MYFVVVFVVLCPVLWRWGGSGGSPEASSFGVEWNEVFFAEERDLPDLLRGRRGGRGGVV